MVSIKKFLKNLIGFSVSTWVNAIISFIVIPITARLYDPLEFGKISMAQTFIRLFTMIIMLGLDQALIRFYYEPPAGSTKKNLVSICMISTSVILLFCGSILLVFWKYFSYLILEEKNILIIIFIIASIFFGSVLRYLNIVNRMEQKSISYSIQSISMNFSLKVSYLFAAIWSPNHITALGTIAAGQMLLAVIYLFIQKKSFLASTKPFPIKAIKPLLTFGLPLLPVTLLSWLNSSIPQIMIKKYLNYSDVGIYAIGLSIAGIINIIQAGFNIYWIAYVYKNYQSDQKAIQAIHNYLTFIVILFGLSIMLFQDLIFNIIGQKYVLAKQIIGFMLISPIAYTIAETTGIGIGISKKSYLNSITFLISATVNIILSVFLTKMFGIMGAASSAALASGVMLILKTILGEKYYKCIVYKTRFAFSLIILFLPGALVILLNGVQFKIAVIALMALTILLYKNELKNVIKYLYAYKQKKEA